MEIVNLILNIAVIVLIFLVGLFTKNYLPFRGNWTTTRILCCQ